MTTYYKSWRLPGEIWYNVRSDKLYVIQDKRYPPSWYQFICYL